MEAALAARTATLAVGWLVVRTDGYTLAFTDLDQDFIFDLETVIEGWGYSSIPGIDGTGELTYSRAPGYQSTDVENTSALNVDNLEVQGILSTPSITEEDLRAGKWDYAKVSIFYFNYSERSTNYVLTALTRSGSNATATTSIAHTLVTGDFVEVLGATQTEYNKIAKITRLNSTQFRYSVSGTPATPATGPFYYQRRYGPVMLRVGTLGEVSVEAGTFKAELRGLTQYYSRTIGQLTSPSCRADLGDARCQVDLTGGSPAFTVTGSVNSISSDGLVIYDPTRLEPGPTGGIAITNITNANPAVVTLASAVPYAVGQPVTLSGIVGPTALNTTVRVYNPSGSTFELGIDTSDTAVYPPYVSGGTAVALGSDSGYFDGGKITITSGLNTGIFREVKSYVPGQITLWMPFPYDLDIDSPNTTYSMHVGCDKSMTTCRDRFNNIVNFRGEPYLPGVDKLVQVGRHT